MISRLQSVRIHRILSIHAGFIFLTRSVLLMKSRLLLWYCFVCALLSFGGGVPKASAQQPEAVFLLRDTTVQRGSVLRYSVYAVLRNFPARPESVRLVMRYTPSLLLPEAVRGSTASLMLCPEPATTTQFINLSLGSLNITCNQIRLNPGDTVPICTVEFRTLASADSIATVEIESLTVNTTDIVLTGAGRRSRIAVQGEPRVVGRFTDAIEQSYPNPASFSGVTFPYTIASPSTVQFAVFSLKGEEVYRFPDIRQGQGRFLLKYVPAPNTANGLYSLRMITDRGVFRQSFMILR